MPITVMAIPNPIALKLSCNKSIMQVINPKTGNNGRFFIFKGILKGRFNSGEVYLKITTEAFIKMKLKKRV